MNGSNSLVIDKRFARYATLASLMFVFLLGATVDSQPFLLVLVSLALLFVLLFRRRPALLVTSVPVLFILTPTYYVIDAGLAVMSLSIILLFLQPNKQIASPGSLALPVIIIALSTLIPFLFNQPGIYTALAVSSRKMVWPILGLFFGWLAIKKTSIQQIMRGLAIAVSFGALLGLIELILGVNFWNTYGVRFVAEPQWASSIFRFDRLRVSGAFSHPIAYGLFSASMLPIAWGLWRYEKNKVWRMMGLLAICASILGSILSVSRGPLLGLLVLSFCVPLRLAFLKLKARPANGIIIMLIIMLFTSLAVNIDTTYGEDASGTGEQYSNTQHRFALLQVVANMAPSDLLFGQGNYKTSILSILSIDSAFVELIMLRGAVGLSGWLVVVMAPIFFLAKNLNLRGQMSANEVWNVCVVSAILVSLVTYATVAQFGIGNGYFWVLIGVAWALAGMRSRQQIIQYVD